MGQSLLIMGSGPGLSASLARLGAREGMTVALGARNIDKLEILARETGASLHQCDASKAKDVAQMFTDLDGTIGTPDMVVYNPSARVRGPIQDLHPENSKKAIDIICYGAFLVVQ